MPSYQQTGTRTCPKCKQERKEKVCKACGQKTRPSGNWSVRFYYKAGEKNVLKRLSGFETKAEAEGAYNNFKHKYKTDISSIAKLPFLDLTQNYLKYKSPPRVREVTHIDYKYVADFYILPFFKNMDVYKIKKSDIVNWHDWLNTKVAKRSQQPLSYSKKTKIHEYLSSMLNYAIKFFDLQINVAQQVGNFPDSNPQKPEMLFWTEKEFLTFISEVKELEYKTLFSFLYLTGARKGEALASTWKDINFENKLISINKSVTFKTKEKAAYKITAPKNFSSNRTIYLPDTLVELLLNYKKHCLSYEGFAETWFVFGMKRPIPPETIRRIFNAYCEQAKVKQIRIHDFRHSHASLLINKGQNILAVAQRLGHSDIEQTLNTYSHLMPEEQKKLLVAINIAL